MNSNLPKRSKTNSNLKFWLIKRAHPQNYIRRTLALVILINSQFSLFSRLRNLWHAISSSNLFLDQQLQNDLVPNWAASSRVSGRGWPKDSGTKIEATEANKAPKPKTRKGSCLKVTAGKYKVKYGAATETNRLDMELKNEILFEAGNIFWLILCLPIQI